MDTPNHVMPAILKLITDSCNTIASYSVVVLLTLFFPVRSLAVNNKHSELVANIFIPIAVLLSVICCIQVLYYHLKAFEKLAGMAQKILFGVVGLIISLLICIVSFGMLFFSLEQLASFPS